MPKKKIKISWKTKIFKKGGNKMENFVFSLKKKKQTKAAIADDPRL